MSPEQVRADHPDARSDIFSFGAILYEMLTGRRAFLKPLAVETMHAILSEPPKDLPNDVPDYVAAIVSHCLEKKPASASKLQGNWLYSWKPQSLYSGAP